MRKSIQFGEDVAGYNIRVLNEREIRAAAGIMFLATLISFVLIMANDNFLPIKYVIIIFMIDFFIRVVVSPRFAPLLIVGRLIVGRQTPEYVGARQKRFAWGVGLFLSVTMFVFMVVVNAYSPITGITCLLCMVFLFFESAFGICLACKVYSLFNKGRVQYCPGEVCERRTRQDIQKTSFLQVVVVFGFVVFLLALATVFHPYFDRHPYDLFGMYGTAKTK